MCAFEWIIEHGFNHTWLLHTLFFCVCSLCLSFFFVVAVVECEYITLKHLITTIRMQKADLWQECANRTNVESWIWREKKTQTKYFFCGCIAMVFSFFIQPSSAMSIDVEIRKHEPIDFGLSVWKPYHTTSIYYHFFFVFVPSATIWWFCETKSSISSNAIQLLLLRKWISMVVR